MNPDPAARSALCDEISDALRCDIARDSAVGPGPHGDSGNHRSIGTFRRNHGHALTALCCEALQVAGGYADRPSSKPNSSSADMWTFDTVIADQVPSLALTFSTANWGRG